MAARDMDKSPIARRIVRMTVFPAIAIMVGLVALGTLLAAYTYWRAEALEARYPPGGDFVTIEGARVHYRVIPAEVGADDATPLVFVHGASSGLRDALFGPADYFKQNRPVIVLDRPGLGWSTLGEADDHVLPSGQARVIAGLLDHLAIDRVHMVGHSYGASVAATFALDHKDRLAGLMFLAPATHPWPGGVKWYYSAASMPVVGRLFTWTLALPFGERQVTCATQNAFSPNPMPEGYPEAAAAGLILVPDRFRANAGNVANLKPYVTARSAEYDTITAPTLVVSGEDDAVVYPSIHAAGLVRDIPGAQILKLDGVGHMPHHAAPDIVLPAMAAFMQKVDDGENPDIGAADRASVVRNVVVADECNS